MKQETFRPGQMVTWGNLDETMKIVSKENGAGPFKICTIEDIPEDKCNCGGSSNDETHQMYGKCPYSNMGYGLVRKSVGHHQLVTLDDGTGKPLTDILDGKALVRWFSAAYFKAV